jgi:hypothetical protein
MHYEHMYCQPFYSCVIYFKNIRPSYDISREPHSAHLTSSKYGWGLRAGDTECGHRELGGLTLKIRKTWAWSLAWSPGMISASEFCEYMSDLDLESLLI